MPAERVFGLAGLSGTLAMLNILGISRFIPLFSTGEQGGFGQWGAPSEMTFAVAIGVLPYPLTFLCTDLISELWKATPMLWCGWG